MRREELQILIKKYYEGTSSPEEENALREYFNSHDVLPEYEAEKAMFRYFSNLSEIPQASTGFEDRIIQAVDTSDTQRGKLRLLIYSFSAAAAAIMLIISSVFFLKNRSLQEDTYTDPQIAYAETMKILYDISVQLNNGAAALKPVAKINDVNLKGLKVLNESMLRVKNGLGKMGYLDKAIDLTRNQDTDNNLKK